MEDGRGRYLRLLGGLACAALPAWAQASCPFLPAERRLDYELSPDRRAVELRLGKAKKGEGPSCTLALDCLVREDPANMSYTLRPGSILVNDIGWVHFYYPDGATQSCTVLQTRSRP